MGVYDCYVFLYMLVRHQLAHVHLYKANCRHLVSFYVLYAFLRPVQLVCECRLGRNDKYLAAARLDS